MHGLLPCQPHSESPMGSERPGQSGAGIINAAKNIVHTSSTATNMANSFQETVKIYQQGKEYYDGLRKVKNLVRDARKVQQTILMVGDITDIYVTSFERMLSDPYFTPEELARLLWDTPNCWKKVPIC